MSSASPRLPPLITSHKDGRDGTYTPSPVESTISRSPETGDFTHDFGDSSSLFACDEPEKVADPVTDQEAERSAYWGSASQRGSEFGNEIESPGGKSANQKEAWWKDSFRASLQESDGMTDPEGNPHENLRRLLGSAGYHEAMKTFAPESDAEPLAAMSVPGTAELEAFQFHMRTKKFPLGLRMLTTKS